MATRRKAIMSVLAAGLPAAAVYCSPPLLSQDLTFENLRYKSGVVYCKCLGDATDLRAPFGTEYICVGGYMREGDGGHAVYQRVAVEPSHPGRLRDGGGAWFEIVDRVLRPQMFGANPLQDHDHSSAISALLATAGDRRSGLTTVELDGMFNVASVKLHSSCRIVGRNGVSCGLRRYGHPRAPLLVIAPNVSNLEFCDLTIDGRGGSQPQNLIYMDDPGDNISFLNVSFVNGFYRPAVRVDRKSVRSGLHFLNCRWDNCPGGAFSSLPSDSARGSADTNFIGCSFSRVGSTIIGMHAGTAKEDKLYGFNAVVRVVGCRIWATIDDGPYSDCIPLEIWGWDGGECTDNFIDGGTRGISAGAGSRNVRYAGNLVRNQSKYAFECGLMRSCTFEDNLAESCATMFSFTGGGQFGFDIYNCRIANNIGIGTGLKSPSSDLDYISSGNAAPYCVNLKISNNYFIDVEFVRTVIRFLASRASPIVTISGDGDGAKAAFCTLRAIGCRVIESGSGYGEGTAISADGGGGSGSEFACDIGENGEIVGAFCKASGTGYHAAPRLLVNGMGSGAILEAVMGIEQVSIANGGSGYSHAEISVVNNGGHGFRGTAVIKGGSIVAVRVDDPGEGFGRGSNVICDGNQIIGSTFDSCANGLYLDGMDVLVEDNLWKRTANFGSSHYQSSTAIAYMPPVVGNRAENLRVRFINNHAVMLGEIYGGTLMAMGAQVVAQPMHGLEIWSNNIEGKFTIPVRLPDTSGSIRYCLNSDC